MSDPATTDPAGLNLAGIAGWLNTEQPGLLGGPLTASLITGGKSNLTYLVTDGNVELVVRRPPLGHVLDTAHDMGREYRVMNALAPTPVPVPAMIGFRDDPSVLDAPFYVMAKVAGTSFRYASELEPLGPDRTRAIAERLVDTLVDLHAIDYASVGLADFGRPDGYLERQLRRWRKQLDASRSYNLPGIDELADRLDASIPSGGGATIVHGDFRLDNALVDTTEAGGDRITAILDWEMSTLGDPLSDLALMLAYLELGALSDAVSNVSQAPGHPSIDEVIQQYATRSGRDVGDLGFHLGLAYFKLAVILQGIHLRFTQGKTVGPGFENIGDMTGPIIAAGLEATAR